MPDIRKPIFDAIRQARGNVAFTGPEVAQVDRALSDLGIPWNRPEVRKISAEGLAMIKGFEGLRLRSYKDAAGVWTIGYGSTMPDVGPDMKITVSEAETRLLRDLRRFEECVERRCPGLNDNQYAACVSLAFNIGCTAFEKSTVARMAAAGNHARAKAAFGLWIKAGGKPLLGLIRRRAVEARLYGTPA